MRKRWLGLATLGFGVAPLSVQVASASVPGDSFASAPVTLARAATKDVVLTIGQRDDAVVTHAGTLDDGKELLAQAGISIDDAIASAQAAVPGATSEDIGEVDLESFDGTLVFNVDVGDKDVKVDASTGEVLSTNLDD
jgi:uncharacterized membrane protein YkoI